MALTPGTVKAFPDSLAELIDRALAGEWLAVKGEPLPPADPEDRRILLAAIAQGVIDYLRQHQTDFVLVPAAGSTLPVPTVRLRAASLTVTAASGGGFTAQGGGFAPGQAVTLVWDATPPPRATATPAADGTFSTALTAPAGTPAGRHGVEARDTSGNVAQATVTT